MFSKKQKKTWSNLVMHQVIFIPLIKQVPKETTLAAAEIAFLLFTILAIKKLMLKAGSVNIKEFKRNNKPFFSKHIIPVHYKAWYFHYKPDQYGKTYIPQHHLNIHILKF